MRIAWFYSHAGEKVIGPCSSSELRGHAASRRLLPSDRVRKHGMASPVLASRIRGLFPVEPKANGADAVS
jgi:hypothetical protein